MEQYECKTCGAIKNIRTVKCEVCGGNNIFLVAYDDLSTTPTEFALKNKICNEETTVLARAKLAECYERIVSILKEYVDTEEKNYKIIAMWIIGTYFHDSFVSYPYLFFNAMRGSGKTRTLKLISSLAAKGDGSVQNNLTEAVLFRIPKGTTTCIDEVEQIGKKEKQTLRELLNSAYKKGMKVKRMRKMHTKEGEMQVTECFEPYFPIAMANIWGLEEVLADRAVTIILEKSANKSITKIIEDFDTNPNIVYIKRTLNEISDVSAVTLRKKKYIEGWNDYIKSKYITTSLTTLTTYIPLITLIPQQQLNKLENEELFAKIDKLDIFGRNLELFLPLLLLAEEIKVLDEFLIICSELSNKKKDEEYAESRDVLLYDFVYSISNFGLEFIPIKELTHRFRDYVGDAEDEDKWLNERWIGRALKRLNLIIDSRKMAAGRQVILNYVKAKEKLNIFKRGEKNETSNN